MTTTISTPTTTRRPRASRAARRFGYGVAVAINLVMLYLIHGWPGWDAVPFLSAETTDVLPYVDASIVATILVNVVYVVRDGRAVKASGELVTNLVSLLSLIRFWQVQPFDFGAVWGGWQPLVYVLLVVATVGTVISALVQGVTLVRATARG
jgi:hypothetical protein